MEKEEKEEEEDWRGTREGVDKEELEVKKENNKDEQED